MGDEVGQHMHLQGSVEAGWRPARELAVVVAFLIPRIICSQQEF